MFITLLTRAGLTLLIEGGLACILAVLLGYLFWRSKNAALALGLTTFAGNVFLLLILSIAFDPNRLPFHLLNPQMAKFPDDVASYLTNIYLILEVAMWGTALVGTLGYFLNEGMGATILTSALALVATFCVIVTAVPFYAFGISNTTWFLVIAVVLVGTVGIWLFSRTMVQGKGIAFFALLWFEFFFTCWIGYQVAGRIGLLLITLPAQGIFWGALYYFSILSLPIPGHEKIPTLLNLLPFDAEVEAPVWGSLFPSGEDDARTLTFRSVLTLAMGTNYPYYVIEDWKTRETMNKEKPAPRVKGDLSREYFAGPGIILSNCDHLAVTSDGIKFRVCSPGLSFTEQFEQLYTDVDLRPQLRVTTIEAKTKDGITTSVFTFMPNRVWADGREVQLGGSYPFNDVAVVNAVYGHSVMEHKFARDENQLVAEEITRRPWAELILTIGPPILKDIIANYTCDELYMTVAAPDKSRYGLVQIKQPFDSKEVDSLYSTNLPLEAKLQQFMARHLDADDLKDLAFDLSADFSILAGETESELARALVEATAMKRGALNYLAHQVQLRWPSTYIAQLFPSPSTDKPPTKVQITVKAEEDSHVRLDTFKSTLSAQFNVTTEHITIIGATKRALRFLVGIPKDAVDKHPLSKLQLSNDEGCQIVSLTAFDDLSREARNAWRYASCSAPPTLIEGFIQPEIAWNDALAASRVRTPRVEIASTFVGRLKEEMQPLGIEVVGGRISDIKVSEEIVEQRRKKWNAERDKDIEIAVAEAKARIALHEQEVLAEARLEMLTKLIQILQEAKRGVDKRIVAIKLFEAMGIHPPSDPESQVDKALQQVRDGDCLPPYLLELLQNTSNAPLARKKDVQPQ